MNDESSARDPHDCHSDIDCRSDIGRKPAFSIAARGWRGPGGKRLVAIGPLPLIDADSFAAVYMEGVFEPGMKSLIHRHPGVEAWYTLEGEQCLETPRGKLVLRRSLVLVLQDATKPRSTPASDWVSKGLCRS